MLSSYEWSKSIFKKFLKSSFSSSSWSSSSSPLFGSFSFESDLAASFNNNELSVLMISDELNWKNCEVELLSKFVSSKVKFWSKFSPILSLFWCWLLSLLFTITLLIFLKEKMDSSIFSSLRKIGFWSIASYCSLNLRQILISLLNSRYSAISSKKSMLLMLMNICLKLKICHRSSKKYVSESGSKSISTSFLLAFWSKTLILGE